LLGWKGVENWLKNNNQTKKRRNKQSIMKHWKNELEKFDRFIKSLGAASRIARGYFIRSLVLFLLLA
jgi:hypothetical protein